MSLRRTEPSSAYVPPFHLPVFEHARSSGVLRQFGFCAAWGGGAVGVLEYEEVEDKVKALPRCSSEDASPRC
ncbi:hypothetical protein OF83DRAFT_1177333 [Amylostereum chailletii]|nr:hypothetical protein OF83DRAFT_1177333 [Amylostereum chailletii]